MSRWASRSRDLEIIDKAPPDYSRQEYEDCLIQLDRVGQWLGGDSATFATLKKMQQAPLSLLDVGCGGGFFTTKLALRYPQAKITGIDLNHDAIAFAKNRLARLPQPPQNLNFETCVNAKLEEPEKSYDVVLTTLVCHHMDDDHLIDFIHRACRIAKKRVIINDLQRHFLAYYLFKGLSPLFFRNRLVQHDGPLSIRRAFAYKELLYYLEKAGLKPSQFCIQWKWAFRWLIEIDCEEKV